MSDLSLTSEGNLRAAGLSHQQQLRRAANQFEAQFLQIVMKESRTGIDGESDDALFGDSNALNQFQEMLHSSLIERSAGGMGIAEMLVRQLTDQGADHG